MTDAEEENGQGEYRDLEESQTADKLWLPDRWKPGLVWN